MQGHHVNRFSLGAVDRDSAGGDIKIPLLISAYPAGHARDSGYQHAFIRSVAILVQIIGANVALIGIDNI